MEPVYGGLGRCACCFWLAVVFDVLGLLVLLLGVFVNVFFYDLLIYAGAIIIFLSLVWWVFWYSGNIEVPPAELQDDVGLLQKKPRGALGALGGAVRRLSRRVSGTVRGARGKRRDPAHVMHRSVCLGPIPVLLQSYSSPAPDLLQSCSRPTPVLLQTYSSPAPDLLQSCSRPTPVLLQSYSSCSSPTPVLLQSYSSPAPDLLQSCSSPTPVCSRPTPVLLQTYSSPAPAYSSPAPDLLQSCSRPTPVLLWSYSGCALVLLQSYTSSIPENISC
ncbi:hypothetical protein WMY93_001903 [Mugilogobius chulae]|uniref:Uncharacterized protein n=1 Tax=Mugilogobius chulae TaxID=88201 RepID=A0AAW0Q2Z4_9GOBI